MLQLWRHSDMPYQTPLQYATSYYCPKCVILNSDRFCVNCSRKLDKYKRRLWKSKVEKPPHFIEGWEIRKQE